MNGYSLETIVGTFSIKAEAGRVWLDIDEPPLVVVRVSRVGCGCGKSARNGLAAVGHPSGLGHRD